MSTNGDTDTIEDVARFFGWGVLALPLIEADRVQVQPLNLRPRPVCRTKEFQAAVDGRFVVEAMDVDPFPQPLPAVLGDQVFQDRLERDAVQRIVGLGLVHGDIGDSRTLSLTAEFR
ncbi:hypothetical protein Pla22_24340 [Rubripirellula amarantea]|uniref:Uncharacterized protein n=1 Tax=Rubripirellula amarantea TaxID=2527999 RepID=A0A5C5WW32_9BACT|nr:hypothetical protein Pla22_24340 [Rubripirellula amarantea]